MSNSQKTPFNYIMLNEIFYFKIIDKFLYLFKTKSNLMIRNFLAQILTQNYSKQILKYKSIQFTQTTKKRLFLVVFVVLKTGIEPVRYRYRRILSPVRLPVPPLQRIGGTTQIRTGA